MAPARCSATRPSSTRTCSTTTKKILAGAGYQQPPADWAQLKEIANKTTKKDGSGNYKGQGLALIQDGDNQTAHPFLSLLNSAGGQFLNSSGDAALDDKAKSVMQLESDLAKSGATTTSVMPTKTFPANGTAMAIQASWWIGSLKAQMKGDYANVGTAPIPGPAAGQRGSLAYAFFTCYRASSTRTGQCRSSWPASCSARFRCSLSSCYSRSTTYAG